MIVEDVHWVDPTVSPISGKESINTLVWERMK
jgi:hypothetical protein